MKLKFWQFEYDFDKEDAKIVVPIILLLIALSFTTFDRQILVLLTAFYYLLYFFLREAVSGIKSLIPTPKLKCPKCKNRKIILQGYQGYKSDEQYAHYFCTDCGQTSILTDGGLLPV